MEMIFDKDVVNIKSLQRLIVQMTMVIFIEAEMRKWIIRFLSNANLIKFNNTKSISFNIIKFNVL